MKVYLKDFRKSFRLALTKPDFSLGKKELNLINRHIDNLRVLILNNKLHQRIHQELPSEIIMEMLSPKFLPENFIVLN